MGITLIMVISALIVLIFTIMNWKFCFKLIFFIIIFEGALRKWFLPGASDFLYFVKDFIFLGTFIGFSFTGPKNKYLNKQNSSMIIMITFLTLWCIAQMFNPRLDSFFIGLYGIRVYILYIPIIWMIPYVFKTQDQLCGFLKKYLLLSIPICILGFFQFFSSPSGILNKYVGSGDEVGRIATFGGFELSNIVRITGTFSYIAGFTFYLLFCFCMIMALLTAEKSKGWRYIYIIEATLIFMNTLMTGSRTPIILISFVCIGYILYNRKEVFRILRKIWIPALLLLIVFFIYFNSILTSFSNRIESADNLGSRIGSEFDISSSAEEAGFFGFGIGSTQNGKPSLLRLLNIPENAEIPSFESEMSRITLELGLVGFAIWYVLRIVIVLALFKSFRILKSPVLKNLALMGFLIHLFTITSMVVTVPTFIPYFWLIASFVYLLPYYQNLNNSAENYAK